MKHNIDELLERYWDAETTIEEENIIKTYFSGSEVQDRHLPYSALFASFVAQSAVTYSGSAFDSLDDNTPVSDTKNTAAKVFSIKKWVYAAAAIFVLGVCSIFVVKNLNNDKKVESISQVQEIEDPEEALRVTKQALALVSKKLNKSKRTVKENLAELEKASIFK